MMSRDYRETLEEQLGNEDFRRDLAQVMFEQDGLEGLHMWLNEVTLADAWNEAHGHVNSSYPTAKDTSGLPPPNAQTDADLAAFHAMMKKMGFDIRVVPAGG